jgi:hypothetical protein
MTDDLEIPAFLRREPLDKTQPLPAWINGAGRQREWIMPDRSKYQITEGEMAKAENVVIENPAAPIEIWGRNADDTDVVLAHTFPDKAAFEAWYSPKAYQNIGGSSTAAITAIMFNVAASAMDFSGKAPTERSLGKPAKPAKERVAHEHDYIVNSHVGLLLKAKGFKKKSVGPDMPMTFGHADGRTVIIPAPEAGKKSSSKWIVNQADGQVVATGFGLSLKEKL